MNFTKAVNFAMRNGLWHCEISHCEIFALRILYCEIFALRNWNWQCKFKIGIAKWHLALRNFALRNFRIAKLELALRNLKLALRNGIWHCEISHCEIFALRILGCEIFALRNGFANCLRKSSLADFPCFSSCLQLHLILSTFSLFFH